MSIQRVGYGGNSILFATHARHDGHIDTLHNAIGKGEANFLA